MKFRRLFGPALAWENFGLRPKPEHLRGFSCAHDRKIQNRAEWYIIIWIPGMLVQLSINNGDCRVIPRRIVVIQRSSLHGKWYIWMWNATIAIVH